MVVSLNYNNFNSGKIDVSISLVENSNSISFSNNTRYIEKFCYIPQGEYEEFAITFATSGTKTIQTFGMHDTVIELYKFKRIFACCCGNKFDQICIILLYFTIQRITSSFNYAIKIKPFKHLECMIL